ncbi:MULTISPECIES: 2-methylaconitate cis-trans isomerase PrpF family protein [unclassified Mycobacterium]|uniref:2-methylaconitate cis-trans isomerase PrpF family protein n=1 Tax=unclassified Mycobacterium TaxID=2642494 RepID=UPI0029C78BBF|nr:MULTISPECIES: PrpF domain-containing protein [unclassified Mycobacterium]
MLISLPAMQFRGGTSKGVYLLADDLAAHTDSLDAVLSALMGGAPRQVDGLGGDATTTSKVAIVGPSAEDGIDVDYLFAQVDPTTGAVDRTPTCGNILAGVGPFAIERGLVPVTGDVTEVRIRLVNTGARVVAAIQTPNGAVDYSGDQSIAGVSGSAAPVQLTFTDFAGGTTGTLFPTGNRVDHIDGVEVSCVDAGVCAIIMRAADLGLTGGELPAELNGDDALFERIERIRRKAGELMGMGDVSGRVVPKVMLVSESDDADIRSRYLVPTSCHPAHAVTGAMNLASTVSIPGTVAHEFRSASGDSVISIEHPGGVLELGITLDGDAPVGATITSTARKLFDGNAFVEFTPTVATPATH